VSESTDTATGRRRDAAASRERLLLAAAELFAERGYDRTTARDIGRLAGVDPAMIARYFGGKAQLYIAVLDAETTAPPVAMLDPDRLLSLLRRGRTPGPIYQVATRPHDDPAGQEATRAELHRRLIEPLRARLVADGVPDAELRAEVMVAAFVGVVLGRASGAFDALPLASDEELQQIVLDMLTPRPE
jgi:AcrR family transcriptional regulator